MYSRVKCRKHHPCWNMISRCRKAEEKPHKGTKMVYLAYKLKKIIHNLNVETSYFHMQLHLSTNSTLKCFAYIEN